MVLTLIVCREFIAWSWPTARQTQIGSRTTLPRYQRMMSHFTSELLLVWGVRSFGDGDEILIEIFRVAGGHFGDVTVQVPETKIPMDRPSDMWDQPLAQHPPSGGWHLTCKGPLGHQLCCHLVRDVFSQLQLVCCRGHDHVSK